MNIVPTPVSTAMENLTEEANAQQNPAQGSNSPENPAGVSPVSEENNAALTIYDTITVEEFRIRLERFRDASINPREGEGAFASPARVPLVHGDINTILAGLDNITDEQLRMVLVEGRDNRLSNQQLAEPESSNQQLAEPEPEHFNAPEGGGPGNEERNSDEDSSSSDQGDQEDLASPPPVTRNVVNGFAPYQVVNWLEAVGYFHTFRTEDDEEGNEFRNAFATQGIAGRVLLDLDMREMRTNYGMNPGQAHYLMRIVKNIPRGQGMIYFSLHLPRRIC